MNEPSPSAGSPFSLKPDGRVSTTWKVLGTIIGATAILVGGIFSVKNDISDAATKAKEALELAKDIRSELLQVRIALGLYDPRITIHPSASAIKDPKGSQP